jgi:Predicted ATPase
VIVFDTLHEKTYDNFRRVESFSELIQILKQNESFYRIAYRGINDRLDMETDFDFCCRAVNACRDVHFAVEEIGLHSNSWKMPTSLQSIVSAGRHREISFSCTSQRASNVHPLIRALATDIVTFQQSEPRDIEWLSEVIGEQSFDVPNLQQYKFLHWNDKTATQITPIDNEDEKEDTSDELGVH